MDRVICDIQVMVEIHVYFFLSMITHTWIASYFNSTPISCSVTLFSVSSYIHWVRNLPIVDLEMSVYTLSILIHFWMLMLPSQFIQVLWNKNYPILNECSFYLIEWVIMLNLENLETIYYQKELLLTNHFFLTLIGVATNHIVFAIYYSGYIFRVHFTRFLLKFLS